MGQVFVNKYLL